MGVVIIPAPPKPIPPRPRVVWDVSMNYKEDEERFYARSDIDHKVYLSDKEVIYVNPNTGEIKDGEEED